VDEVTVVEKCVDFQISVPDQPGELFRITKGLQEAHVNLRALWGFGIGGGHAEIIVVPEDPDRFRAHAMKSGLEFRERTVVHVTGKDEVGALVDTVERIAASGINIDAFDAIAMSGRYGAFCWVADADRDQLEDVLGT
jgi:prephenate dehydratase